jgi:hypothetical protein
MTSNSHMAIGPLENSSSSDSSARDRFLNRATWTVAFGMYEGVLIGLDASLNMRSLTIGVADSCQPQTGFLIAPSSRRLASPRESMTMMRGATWASKIRVELGTWLKT